MISSPGERSCFVYVALPGETESVTASKFTRRVDRHGVAIGEFFYGQRYLARPDAVPLDPIELKLGRVTYTTTLLNGVFGALRDASPDYWGRLVIDRHFGSPAPEEIDYLLCSPDDRAGALGFGSEPEPPPARRKFNRTLDLEALQAFADAIVADEELPQHPDAGQVPELMHEGTSMGGARPKAVVEDDDGLWIAKFNRPDDKWNHARVEHSMLVLARACALRTAESKVATVGDRDALLVKRFDRKMTEGGYLRASMLSALTLLRAEDAYTDRAKWSYVLLAEELRRLSAQPGRDAAELFRRMCFNALTSNTDDHPRNHAVIATDDRWELSPAHDLVPSPHVSLERRDLAMACGDMGRYANAENLLSQHARFLLSAEDAKETVDSMETKVREQWRETALAEGVSRKDCDTIAGAFAYPGFRLALT